MFQTSRNIPLLQGTPGTEKSYVFELVFDFLATKQNIVFITATKLQQVYVEIAERSVCLVLELREKPVLRVQPLDSLKV